MSKTKEFSKKVIAVKLVLIVILGLILGASCFFSKDLEKLFNIGDKEGNFVSSELIQDSKLSVHYINVGQGDSTLICLPDDKVMLIDAGKSSASEHIVEYIQTLGIDTIDYFIATHSDDDHVGGAKAVFEAFDIKRVYRPFQISVGSDGEPTEYEMLGAYLEDTSLECNEATENNYELFLELAYTETYVENGTTYNAEVWCSYDGITLNSSVNTENYTIEFFAPVVIDNVAFDYAETKTIGYPTKSYTSHSDNNASPIILLEYNNASFMFTGDAAFDAEEDFLASLETDEQDRFKNVNVYHAGHHGSNTSNSQELLELITPTYVVVSCKNSEYGHPGQYFVDRLASLPHTVSDYLLITENIGNIVFGFKSDGTLGYTALKSGDIQVTIYWWQIALGLFVVISVIIISVKVTTNKKATAKRVVSTTKRVTKKFKNN